MLILTYFGAYDMDKLMSTPFCHVMYLYDLAQKAKTLTRLDGTVSAAALHDQTLIERLQTVETEAIIDDKDAMRQVFSEENKRAANERAEKILKKMRGESNG
jgi:hypothetical protein